MRSLCSSSSQDGREIHLLVASQHPLQPLGDDALDDCVHNGFLAGEVAVDLPDAHLRLFRDLPHARGVEPVTHDTVLRRRNNLAAPELIS